MKKPTYYLWQNNKCTKEEIQEIQKAKEQLMKWGFRVVIFQEGNKEGIEDAFKMLAKNHIKTR